MSESDDHQLLAEFARAESEPAFATLVARYVNLVYSTALRRTGNTHHAEEITQAVFIILARKANTLSSRVVLSGWLYQTARLTAANFTKTEARRRQREQEAYMESTVNEPGDAVWHEMAPLLEEALGRLGQTDRNAILLRFFANKNSAEIGAALRMNEEAARRRVNRALEKLRRFFLKRGIASGVATIGEALSLHSVLAAPVGLTKSISAVAMAKGAAAGASTLTLVKGALKLMAWTKAKTAVVVGVGVLLAAGTTSVVVVRQASLIQGKTESEWIKSIVYNGGDEQTKLWHSFGPKGIKMLLHAMQPPAAGLNEKAAIANWKQRMAAADLLGALEDTYADCTNALPGVIKLLQTEKDDRVRGLEISYFELPIQRMSERNKAALLPELIRSMQGSDESERNNTLVALQYYANQKESVVPLIVNAMQDSSPLVRMMAVKALNKIDPQNSASSNFVSVLAGCVTAPPGTTPSAANEAVVALGEFHRKPAMAVPALIEALGSSQFWCRANAAAALGRFGGQARTAIPALQKALKDSDASVRHQATEALKRINSNAPPK